MKTLARIHLHIRILRIDKHMQMHIRIHTHTHTRIQGSSISKEIGALLAYSLGITRTSFGNMWLLCLICVLCNPLPLLLLDKLVPQEGAEGRTETGNGNGNGNGNDIGQGRGNGRGLEQGEEEGGLGCGVQRGNGVHRRDRIENGRALGAERV